MTIRTLAEAAAEILNASKTSAPAEGPSKLPGEVVDLGGSTNTKPEGDEIGKKAAAAATKAPARLADKPVAAESSSGTVKEEEEYEEELELTEEELDEFLNSLTEEELAELEAQLDGEVEELNEGPSHREYSGYVDDHPFTLTVPRKQDLSDLLDHPKAHEKVAKQNPHLKPHHVKAILNHDGENGNVKVEHGGKTYTHRVEIEDEPRHLYKEEVELTEEEVAAALAQAKEAKAEMIREKIKAIGIEEDMNALFNGEELSEEFKTKAATIFESAVIARAIDVAGQLEAEILAAAEESVEEIKTELEEQINQYLGYVVEEWKEDNKVAIQSGLRSEIVEDFMHGLRNLFVENYIDIPEDRVDVVQDLSDKVDELTSDLNEALNTIIEMNTLIQESDKKEILLSVCEGLTSTQVEKMKTLAEGIEFTADGEYRDKLELIRESYFTKRSENDHQVTMIETLNEEVPEGIDAEVTSHVMDHYVKAISRTIVK